MHAPVDLHHRMPIHTRVTGRLDACTIRAGIKSTGSLQTLHRSLPKARNEKQDPTQHTTGTPIYQALR